MFPDALKYRDEKICIQDFDIMDLEAFAAEILLDTMDKSAGENWNGIEEALAFIDFNNKFPLPNHKENETDQEDDELMKTYLQYMDKLSSRFIICTEYRQEFF